MHSKVTFAAWLLAILFISQTICDDKEEKEDKKDSTSPGGSGNKTGGGGNRPTTPGVGDMTFNMNGMSGIQLPFPFFPPFGCDSTCQPMQLQIFQPQQVQQPPAMMPTTQAPTTTPRPKPTTPAPRPAPTTTTYTSQTIIMYPNWCQGWCKFFYQPPPQPVYYQPNCLLFSWMGMGPSMGPGMGMGMQATS